jgi:hypothetical protein
MQVGSYVNHKDARFEVFTMVKIQVEVLESERSANRWYLNATLRDVTTQMMFTLKTEAVRSAETLISYWNTTRRYNPDYVHPENGVSKVRRNTGTCRITTRRRNPENLDLSRGYVLAGRVSSVHPSNLRVVIAQSV